MPQAFSSHQKAGQNGDGVRREGASPFHFPASLFSGDTKPTQNIVLEKSHIHKIYLDNLFLVFSEKM